MRFEAVRKRLFHKSPARTGDLGQHITANCQVCGGRPTFKGSRIIVWQMLDQVAEGMPWEQICWSWREKITHEAIAAAVQLAAGQFKETSGPHAPLGCTLVHTLPCDRFKALSRTAFFARKSRIPVGRQ